MVLNMAWSVCLSVCVLGTQMSGTDRDTI